MKHRCFSMPLKTAAFLLAVLLLVVGVFAGVGTVCMMKMEAYTTGREEVIQNNLEDRMADIACDIVNFCVQDKYAPAYSRELWSYQDARYYEATGATNYRYRVYDENGTLVKSTYNGEPALAQYSAKVYGNYLKDYEWVCLDQPWTVEGFVLEELSQEDDFSLHVRLVNLVYDLRVWAPVATGLCLLGELVLVVYLLCGAGRRPGRDEIALNPFDRIPGDLYLGALLLSVALLFQAAAEFSGSDYWWGQVLLWCICLAVGWSLILSFLITLSARLKFGHGYVYRQTIVFRCLKLARWCLKKLWHFAKRCLEAAGRLLRMLPLVWQWVALGAGLFLLIFIAILDLDGMGPGLLLVVVLPLWLLATVYLAHSLGTLQKGVHLLAEGHLEERLDETRVFGNFRIMARDLNDLSAGASREVERRMRSERMKTELITNVSHDIKTPLTSIVNYVDLLQKPHSQEEESAWLEVLARQSQRLKKLTEDLVEMSKASSGNIPVDLKQTNASELVNQALAEYEGKLEKANLSVIKNLPAPEATVLADGRLLWRVLDNLLNNCVKYAQPGTRVYVDLTVNGKQATVSVKNISAQPLNISAEELMERFVRGDRSRNTEGSGLGLNIARNLMELQHGSLRLSVDGDLFKAVLTLPTE